ncbi:unnamed protein product [Mycetohabitans rhizoxinica HKI 454]|uniref:Uncharacterized protein n=1 Tax=Mycetohabitans rhizoxinica (strain DSM 19002 / CIP 109453 / HKI 454) TaxID=882378 RepID=E5AT03_MYCRK|nr:MULTISPECIES: hypothetical protein [Mycetohabitans]MCG1045915.1 hypothetical protein [Mycetohabitans sp. B6]CBW73547.1 unnamed protein product [Mycetohabitans rhizoxinica HKI 454]
MAAKKTLSPQESFILDQRDLAWHLETWRDYAALLPFDDPFAKPGSFEKDDESWKKFFFPSDEAGDSVDPVAALLKAVAQPNGLLPSQQAFLVAFLASLNVPRDLFNTIPARHRALYYRDELSVREKPAVPDQVMLSFTPSQPSLMLPAGERFSAGQDSAGTPLEYRLDEDVWVNQAMLTDVCWYQSENHNDNPQIQHPATKRVVLDTLGQSATVWPNEGVRLFSYDPQRDQTVVRGRVVASPVLAVAQGEREIEVMFDGVGGLMEGDQNLSAWMSGEKGWVPLKRLPIIGMPPDAWKAVFVLQADQGAIAVPAGLDGFNDPVPLLKITCPLADIPRVKQINVTVHNSTQVMMATDDSVAETGKKSTPFGEFPSLGSSLYLMSPDWCNKPDCTLTITLNPAWTGLPTQNFHDWYQWDSVGGQNGESGYAIYGGGVPANNQAFTVKMTVANGQSDGETVPLYDNQSSGDAPPPIGALLTFNEIETLTAPIIESTDPHDWKQYLRFELTGQDFGHAAYQNSLVAPQYKKTPTIIELHPPYTPRWTSLFVLYELSTTSQPTRHSLSPPSESGCAIASPVLAVAGGQRMIEVMFDASIGAREGLSAWVSGENRSWIPLQNSEEIDDDKKASFVLQASQGAIALPAGLDGFNDSMPLLKMMHSSAGIPGVTQINVTVLNSPHVLMATDGGVTEIDKENKPFGDSPVLDSSFYLMSPDWCNKPDCKLTITLNPSWMGLPTQSFQSWYEWDSVDGQDEKFGYAIYGGRVPENNQVFTVEMTVASRQPAMTSNLSDDGRLPLFEDKSPGNASPPIGASLAFNAIDALTATIIGDTDPRHWDQYLRFKLTGQDFEHAVYQSSQNAPLYKKTPTIIRLHPPYTPQWASLSVSYKLSTAALDTQYRLTPFGHCADDAPMARELGQPARQLMLGFSGIQPGQDLALYWKVRAANPDVLLSWDYLSQDKDKKSCWQTLDMQVHDKTGKLSMSGLWRTTLPHDASHQDPAMPAGRYWVRAQFKPPAQHEHDGEQGGFAVSDDAVRPSDFPWLLGLNVNCMTATLVNVEHIAADHLTTPLPADTVTRSVEPIEGLQTITQPWPSEGGQPVEETGRFYQRIAQCLHHRGRALTWGDIRQLLTERYTEIHDVREAAPRVQDKDDPNAHPLIQRLVVIPTPDQSDSGDRLRPAFNASRLKQMKQFILDRATLWLNLEIGNPAYRDVPVAYTIDFTASTNPDQGYRQVAQALSAQYMPWANGSSPGEVRTGVTLDYYAMLAFIERLPIVMRVKSLLLDGQARTVEANGLEALVLTFGERTSTLFGQPQQVKLPADYTLVGNRVRVSHDGQYLAVDVTKSPDTPAIAIYGPDSQWRHIDLVAGQTVIFELTGPHACPGIAYLRGTAVQFDLLNNQPFGIGPSFEVGIEKGTVTDLSVEGNGQFIAVAQEEGCLRFWTLNNNTYQEGQRSPVTLPDGNGRPIDLNGGGTLPLVANYKDDTVVYVYSDVIHHPDKLVPLESASSTVSTLSRNAQVIACAYQTDITINQIQNGIWQRAGKGISLAQPVTSVSLSDTGYVLAAGTADGKQVEIWIGVNGPDPTLLQTLEAETGFGTSVSLSGNGLMLAMGGEQDSILLYRRTAESI